MADGEKAAFAGNVIGIEREIKEITDAIERSGSGAPPHIAIIAEPMSGRTTIVDEIRRIYSDRVHYLPLKFVINQSALPDFSSLPGDIILIENCQFLTTRVIGGFDVLDTFLHMQITSKKIFITTWNTYSWHYLSSVMNIDAYFPTIVTLTRMDAPLLKQVILSRYKSGEIRFVDGGADERAMFFSVIHQSVRLPFTATEISVPWIKLNFILILHGLPRKKRVQISIEDVIFEKINRIARGNPGVAILLWNASLKDNAISLSAITVSSYSISLDPDESFILSVILSMESLHAKDLSAIAGSEMDIERVLYRLIQQGLVRDDTGYYSIMPFALGPVTEYLKKTRRLW
ncbi:MAG: ATP-binding protein [Methanoregula sp.]|nr:ATP-binding protein [Methanoregula sp.]